MLAVGGGELAVGQAVQGGFVLGAPQHLEADAEAGQEIARERHLGGDTGQADQADLLQLDLVEGGGEIVALIARAELAEGVGIGDGVFAAGPEATHGVPQLLRNGQPVLGLGQPDQDARDPRIARRGIERHHRVGHGRRRTQLEGEQIGRTGGLAEARAPVGGQQDAVRQCFHLRHETPDDDPARQDHEQGQAADGGEQADQEAAHGRPALRPRSTGGCAGAGFRCAAGRRRRGCRARAGCAPARRGRPPRRSARRRGCGCSTSRCRSSPARG